VKYKKATQQKEQGNSTQTPYLTTINSFPKRWVPLIPSLKGKKGCNGEGVRPAGGTHKVLQEVTNVKRSGSAIGPKASPSSTELSDSKQELCEDPEKERKKN